jgi:hypothetical protein
MASDEGSQYLAGFFDGDGSINVSRRKGFQHARPLVCFSQSCDSQEPPELTHIQDNWGGKLRNKSRKSPQRRQWDLRIFKKEDVLTVLLAIEPHCIIKLAQVSDTIAFLEYGTKAHAEGYALRMHEWKKQYRDVAVDSHRLTDAYIAGLFAAEGSVGMYQYQLQVTITQYGCPKLLKRIRTKIHAGSVNLQGHLRFRSRIQCKAILDRIAPFISGQKAPQVELVRDFLQVIPNWSCLWTTLRC